VGLLGLTVVAGLLHPRAWAAVAVVGVVLAAALIWPWLTLRGLRARWHYPLRRAQVGKPVTVGLTIRSRLPWPAVGLLARGGWADAPNSQDPVAVAVAHVPPWGPCHLLTTAVPQRRGVFPRGPGTLATGFPFGLGLTRRVEPEGQVLVWPEVVAFATAAPDPGSPGRGLEGVAQRAGQHGDYSGTRPYRVGEALRRVHWKQSARHDELIVWETRPVRRGSAVVLLETAAEVHSRAPAGDSLEKTLSVGASVVNALVRAGVEVTLAFGREPLFTVGNGRQLEAALDALALFDPAEGADLDALLARLPPRGPAPWIVTTLRGWLRRDPRAAPHRAVVIGDGEKGRAAGPHRGKVAFVPLADPGHRGLLEAWKEVAVARRALV
jgi:uncharacterized protein (DUF58 family)